MDGASKLENKSQGEKILFFDEFAVYDRPSMFYGWAEKNTRPQIPSNEKKKRHKVNGLLSIDAISGEEHLQLKSKAKSEDIASYFGLLCDDLSNQGYRKVTIILDNNSTHKDKMKSQLETLMSALDIKDKIKVEFLHTPPTCGLALCSPDFNLTEYIIHLLRLRFLHHLPLNVTIEQIEREARWGFPSLCNHVVEQKLSDYFLSHQLQTPEQIENTIRHICDLVR